MYETVNVVNTMLYLFQPFELTVAALYLGQAVLGAMRANLAQKKQVVRSSFLLGDGYFRWWSNNILNDGSSIRLKVLLRTFFNY